MKVKLIYLGKHFDGKSLFDKYALISNGKINYKKSPLFKGGGLAVIGHVYPAELTSKGSFSMQVNKYSEEAFPLSEEKMEDLDALSKANIQKYRDHRAAKKMSKESRIKDLCRPLGKILSRIKNLDDMDAFLAAVRSEIRRGGE